MIDPTFATVRNGDVDLRVAVAGASTSDGSGDAPLILCIHGWPELWYSWRHQMAHFADRGYRVAAMDVRGYGGSSKPIDVASYALTELCADAAVVIDELGDGSAIVFGHDWGAPIAWNTARLHPGKVRAVAGLSVPYIPVSETNTADLWKALYPDRFFYQTYFQAPDVAEAELGADHARSLRMIYFAASGDADESLFVEKPADATLLQGLVDPQPFPDWLDDDDLAVYVEAFEQGGWTGPINRYRAQGLDAVQIGPLPDPVLTQPAAFIGGEHDGVRNFVPGVDLYESAGAACADFRGTTIVPGAGHWVQQEAPAAVNSALDTFVESL